MVPPFFQQEEARLQRLIRDLPLEPRAKVQGELARALTADALRIEAPPSCLPSSVKRPAFAPKGAVNRGRRVVEQLAPAGFTIAAHPYLCLLPFAF